MKCLSLHHVTKRRTNIICPRRILQLLPSCCIFTKGAVNRHLTHVNIHLSASPLPTVVHVAHPKAVITLFRILIMPSDASFDTFHLVNEPGVRTTSSFSMPNWLISLSTLILAFAVPYIARFVSTNSTIRTYLSRAIVHGKIMTRSFGPQPLYNSWAYSTRMRSLYARPTGLENVDFSCYQNSIIQGISSLESVPDFLQRVQTDETESTAFHLRNMHKVLNSTSSDWSRLPPKLKSMDTLTQQDAQEYYSRVLDSLDKEYIDYINRNESQYGLSTLGEGKPLAERLKELKDAAMNPLEGLMAQRVGCLTCGYSSGLTLTPTNVITVQLPPRRDTYRLLHLLYKYMEPELIEGVQCGKCSLLAYKGMVEAAIPKLTGPARLAYTERLTQLLRTLTEEDYSDDTLQKKCSIPKSLIVTKTKSKQTLFARLPKALVIHINRSMFDPVTGLDFKNPCDVQYPKFLDLRAFCVDASGSSTSSPLSDPSVSMLDQSGEAKPSSKYKLRAVVEHRGTHNDGHYICYRSCAHPADDEDDVRKKIDGWFEMNDEIVSPCTEYEVLSRGQAFMLFYEMIGDDEFDFEAACRTKLPEPTPDEPAGVYDAQLDDLESENDNNDEEEAAEAAWEVDSSTSRKRRFPFNDNDDEADADVEAEENDGLESSPSRKSRISRQSKSPTPEQNSTTSMSSSVAIRKSWTFVDGDDVDMENGIDSSEVLKASSSTTPGIQDDTLTPLSKDDVEPVSDIYIHKDMDNMNDVKNDASIVNSEQYQS
jgi:ubiquitin carboxyl-terminal hydrolase 1